MPLDEGTEPLIQLFAAYVKSIGPRGMVIAGTEDEWHRKRRTAYEQLLWAWPISASELEPAARDPIDDAEERAQLDTPAIWGPA